MDFKIESKRSLIPFLKYEQFFLVANFQNLVNGLIGSAPGNRYMQVILRDFFDPAKL